LGGFEWWEHIGRMLSGAFVFPYMAWGVYTLRLRYRYHEELPALVEALTLILVVTFYVVEMFLLRRYLGHLPVHFMFAILGLVVSGAALYGPMLVSLLSRVVVDLMMPPDQSKTREPRYEPAEALERVGDFDGALGEYLVIARMFPKEPSVLLRIADLYARLDRPAEAVKWYERALTNLNAEDQCLGVTNRLAELYQRKLEQREDAVRVLNAYLSRFPDAEYADSVRSRLQRLQAD